MTTESLISGLSLVNRINVTSRCIAEILLALTASSLIDEAENGGQPLHMMEDKFLLACLIRLMPQQQRERKQTKSSGFTLTTGATGFLMLHMLIHGTGYVDRLYPSIQQETLKMTERVYAQSGKTVEVATMADVTGGGYVLPAATTSTIGGVKKMAAQADSTATDVAGLLADFNALLAKARTAGLM